MNATESFRLLSVELERDWRKFVEVTFVFGALLFLILRSFYTGCNPNDIRRFRKKSQMITRPFKVSLRSRGGSKRINRAIGNDPQSQILRIEQIECV